MTFTPPSPDCPLCPRLCQFRAQNRVQYPHFFNAPVPSFGDLDAELLVVGLAPGLKGANQTGRPFTGDYAGIILYSSLLQYGFAEGHYHPESLMSPLLSSRAERSVAEGSYGAEERSLGYARDDSLRLINCRITNAVRCVPQENKPEPSEIKNCNSFLINEIKSMPKLKTILSLGLISHNAVLKALGFKASFAKFTHGATHQLTENLSLMDSYHCSRYNINTGRLTQAMFDEVVSRI